MSQESQGQNALAQNAPYNVLKMEFVVFVNNNFWKRR